MSASGFFALLLPNPNLYHTALVRLTKCDHKVPSTAFLLSLLGATSDASSHLKTLKLEALGVEAHYMDYGGGILNKVAADVLGQPNIWGSILFTAPDKHALKSETFEKLRQTVYFHANIPQDLYKQELSARKEQMRELRKTNPADKRILATCNPYAFFMGDYRAKHEASLKGKTFGECNKLIGEIWGGMGEVERKPFVERAAECNAKYDLLKKEIQGLFPELPSKTHKTAKALYEEKHAEGPEWSTLTDEGKKHWVKAESHARDEWEAAVHAWKKTQEGKVASPDQAFSVAYLMKKV